MDSFNRVIYNWYNVNRRELPWRKTRDPYKIWISEIILQQTRVKQGIDYYNRFVDAFETLPDLANASEDRVLKLWQGLGYYSRARNLHIASKQIMEKHNGIFPSDYKTILSLKGIGEYTAAAIASIAFGLPYATIDGNVTRVISRYFGILSPSDSETGKSEIRQTADSLMNTDNPGFHNQALMEFGALQCVPKSPSCNVCPLFGSCYAATHKIADQLPVKSKKIILKNRFLYFFFIEHDEFVLLEKRTSNDIWKNLYQLPVIEAKNELTDDELTRMSLPVKECGTVNIKSVSTRTKHVLTHQNIYARFIHAEIHCNDFDPQGYIRVNKNDLDKFAIPKLIERYFRKLMLLE